MDKLSASKRKSPRRSSPRRSSPRRHHTGKLHDPVPMTPMHISSLWIFVAISFLAVCICVFGGKYHGLATRDFKNVDIDGRLRMGALETKTIVGYTPVFAAATSGAASQISYLYNASTTSSAILTSDTTPPSNALVLPVGYVVRSIFMQGGAGGLTGLAQITFAVSNAMPTTAPAAGGGNATDITVARVVNTWNSPNEVFYNSAVAVPGTFATNQYFVYWLNAATVTAGQLKVVIELQRVV